MYCLQSGISLEKSEIEKILPKTDYELIYNPIGEDLNFENEPELFQDIDYILAGLETYSDDFFLNTQGFPAFHALA